MFVLKKSALQLLDFSMMECKIELPPPQSDSDSERILDIMTEYEVRADYLIADGRRDNTYTIYTKVAVNTDGALAGYKIFAEAMSTFLVLEDIEVADKVSFISNNAVSISFGNLRNAIAHSTALYPIGSYSLPVFDLGDLIRLKVEDIDKEEQQLKVLSAAKKKTSKAGSSKKSKASASLKVQQSVKRK